MTDPRVERLAKCYTGVVHDVMRGMGRRDFTLPPTITPLQPDMTLAGPAFTIEGRIDESADPHETLLACPRPSRVTSGAHSRTRI